VIVPLVETDAVADFDSVNDTGVWTVVAALAQLAVAQDTPGVDGLAPPEASTDA
jgi:hypothetical protein